MTGQIIELPWRETRMGGITDHYVVCPTCRAVIQPYSGTSSRGETHGTVFYSHEHPVAVLTLIQSNKSLNRRHELTLPPEAGNEVKEVLEKAGRLWDVHRLSSRQDVKDFLQAEGWRNADKSTD